MKSLYESHQHYQLAVIGSGSREATLMAAGNGLHTAWIEAGKIGGAYFR
jgi:hypothetical protein